MNSLTPLRDPKMPERDAVLATPRRRLTSKVSNPEKLRPWAQLASFSAAFLSVLGLSAAQYVSTPWILAVTAVLGVGIAAIPIFIRFTGLDVYTSKAEVDWLWDESLRSAEQSVEIVAGDLSWLRDTRQLHRVVAALVHKGCVVNVVCKPPKSHPVRRENISALLRAGASVRVLPDNHRPTPFSALLVLDRDNPTELSVCRLQTTECGGAFVDQYIGVSKSDNKSYWGKRELPSRDLAAVKTALALTKAYWECSAPVIVHEELSFDLHETQALALTALREVPIYRNFTSTDIRAAVVRIQDLYSWCIREDKLRSTDVLVDEMFRQGIKSFAPSLLFSNTSATILLPPIVEIHDEKVVVLDGTHRLWHLYRKDPDARATVLTVTAPAALPASPLPFSRLPHFRGQLDRRNDLRSYKPENWRSFTPMEKFLQKEGIKRLEQTYIAFPSPRHMDA